jgi:hypothetical protein
MITTWGIALIAGAWFLGKWTADHIDLLWGYTEKTFIVETLRFLSVPALMAVCVSAACVGIGIIGTSLLMGLAALAGSVLS